METSLPLALQAFCEEPTPESRSQLLKALMAADLLIPVAEQAPEQHGLRLAFARDSDGRTLAPAFTDTARLRDWLRSGGAYAKAPAMGLVGALLAGPFDGLVLNPGAPDCAVVDRGALQALAAGELPQDGDAAEPSVHTCKDMQA